MFGPPEGDAAERILCYGGSDTGKTYSACRIAKRLQSSGSPGQCYVLDTDNAWPRMLASKEFNRLTNITVRPARRWIEYKDGLAEFLNKVTPHDWIVCDFFGTAWTAVQNYFVETVKEQDIDEFWWERAKERAEKSKAADMKRGGFEGFSEWVYINRWYQEWRDDVLWAPCHVYATAVADSLGDFDARSLKEYCREVGLKPKAQKETVHAFSTVLCFNKEAKDERTFTSVRDRERRKVEGKKIGDLSISYLQNVAGWSDPDEDDDDE